MGFAHKQYALGNMSMHRKHLKHKVQMIDGHPVLNDNSFIYIRYNRIPVFIITLNQAVIEPRTAYEQALN